MKDIAAPMDLRLIQAELTKEKLLRHTNNGGNEIYVITHHDSPVIMKEIGRLRELTFRSAGGGTGKDLDIDNYDTCENPYKQLIVWNPEDKEIIGGYRFYECRNTRIDDKENIKLATAKLFKFSEKFIKDYLPYMIELGRSFVVPSYQARMSDKQSVKKGLFALDNLWDGLGSLVVNNPDVKYFFGKVTMYPHYIQKARDYVIYFLKKHFGDTEGLLTPIIPVNIATSAEELKKVFVKDNYLEDYKILFQKVREIGENIPPLINSYMNLSPTMKVFGTAINEGFGKV
ncbi:MAG: hemolysin, partial [Marinilabiliales bacterium]